MSLSIFRHYLYNLILTRYPEFESSLIIKSIYKYINELKVSNLNIKGLNLSHSNGQTYMNLLNGIFCIESETFYQHNQFKDLYFTYILPYSYDKNLMTKDFTNTQI